MNDWIEREIEEWLVTQWREEDELEFETMMDNLPKIKYRYVNKTTRYLLLRSQNWRCAICGTKLKYDMHKDFRGKVAHIDHIHPFSKKDSYNGDINEFSNLQALCPTCNLSKGDKLVLEEVMKDDKI